MWCNLCSVEKHWEYGDPRAPVFSTVSGRPCAQQPRARPGEAKERETDERARERGFRECLRLSSRPAGLPEVYPHRDGTGGYSKVSGSG